jgi:hypothetical protein
MPYTYKAPAAAGGGAVDLGWTRFLLDGATYTDDPWGMHDSLDETDARTRWTSAGAGTLPTADSKKPSHGAIFTRQLFDANGDALDWSEPFCFEMLIEKVSAGSAIKGDNLYFGGGLTGATSGLDDTNGSIGCVSQWDLTTGANYQKTRRFKYNYTDNMSNCNEEWDTVLNLSHGPRHAVHGGMFRMLMYRFDPADPDGATGDTGMGSVTFVGSANKVPTSGPVYVFSTVGRSTTWGTAKTVDFRIWYSVTGADSSWTPA